VGLHEQLLLLGQVVGAMLLAAVVGLERELARKPAGLRTHMLVAGAAALMVGCDFAIVQKFGAATGLPQVKVDPAVVLQAVVTAVGFLGAGTIIHAGRGGHGSPVHIEGLTTAASLLFVAALGSAVGVGLYWLALGITIIGWLTLRGVSKIERRIRGRNHDRQDPPPP
jgi:putative Mg2+ transporter-C (MgtC) family protein